MDRTVDVIVTGIKPGVIRVRLLEDGRKGFVRRDQNMSRLDSLSDEPEVVVGAKVKAVILGEHKSGKVELKLSRLHKPWDEATTQYRVGDIVHGEVSEIRSTVVTVQLESGVKLQILPRGLPLSVLRGEHPRDVLTVGDRVQGIISTVDAENGRIELDINRYLGHLSTLSSENRLELQRELFSRSLRRDVEFHDEPAQRHYIQLHPTKSDQDQILALLSTLRTQTGVSHAVVFEVDPVRKEVAVLAAASPDPGLSAAKASYELFLSPVSEVAIEGSQLNANRIDSDSRRRRFRNLLPTIPYKALVGIPITSPRLARPHALFLFDDYRPSISEDIEDQANLAAHFIQVLLERAAFAEHMHRFESRYFLGTIMGSLVHGLRNRISELRAIARDIQDITSEESVAADTRTAIANKIVTLQDHIEDIGSMVDDYVYPMGEHKQGVDVTAMMHKVRHKIQSVASENSTMLYVNFDDGVPPVSANPAWLEQVVTTVLSHSLLHIRLQQKKMELLSRERGRDRLLPTSLVDIHARYNRSSPTPVQVVILDTGPGTNYRSLRQDNRRSFLPDEHSYGLSASVELLEALGGRIKLLDSVVFLGSALSIELPALEL